MPLQSAVFLDREIELGQTGYSLRPPERHDVPKRIPVGPLAMEVLAEALGFDPIVGFPVVFFDKFPMLWRGGTLVDYGIRDTQFQFLDEATPLPAISGGYPEYHLNLVRDRIVRLPFAGRFQLPDDSGLPGGRYLKGSFRFDNPNYSFQIQAESILLPIIGSLSDLLPPDPQICSPTLVEPDQLATAIDCLERHAMAYAKFSASALALTPSEESVDNGRGTDLTRF